MGLGHLHEARCNVSTMGNYLVVSGSVLVWAKYQGWKY